MNQKKSKPRWPVMASGVRTSGVGPARLERATSCSGGKRSIQLSYGPEYTGGKLALRRTFRNRFFKRLPAWTCPASAINFAIET